MRDRHIPRLCRSCQAPMARQNDKCWRCGIEWTPEAEPRTTLRLIPGGAPGQAEGAPDRKIAAAAAAPVPATAARR